MTSIDKLRLVKVTRRFCSKGFKFVSVPSTFTEVEARKIAYRSVYRQVENSDKILMEFTEIVYGMDRIDVSGTAACSILAMKKKKRG